MRRLGALSLLFIACSHGAVQEADLVDLHAAYLIDDETTTAAPIAEMVSVVPMAADSVLLLDSTEPFLHLYGSQGTGTLLVGRHGGGPAEFLQPGFARQIHDTLWVMDWGSGRIARLVDNGRREVDRLPAPPHLIDILEACGSQTVAVYQGSRSGARARSYGLAYYQSHRWADQSRLQTEKSQLTLSWPDVRAVALADSAILVHDWEGSRLLLLSCSGGVRDSMPVPYPAQWGATPRPHGLAVIGDAVVVFYSDRPNRANDTTYVMLWQPGSQPSTRRVFGDWRLHGAIHGVVWVTHNELIPVVEAFPLAEFQHWMRQRDN